MEENEENEENEWIAWSFKGSDELT